MGTPSLISLAIRYFRRRGYTIQQNVMLEGFSGLIHKFDLLLRKGDVEQVVLVLDWKRPVGVNMTIKADKTSTDVNIPNPMIVARSFSSHAKAYSNRRRINLVTRRSILLDLLR